MSCVETRRQSILRSVSFGKRAGRKVTIRFRIESVDIERFPEIKNHRESLRDSRAVNKVCAVRAVRAVCAVRAVRAVRAV